MLQEIKTLQEQQQYWAEKRTFERQMMQKMQETRKPATTSKNSALLQVGILYGDSRDPIGKSIDAFTGKIRAGSNPFTTPDAQVYSAKQMSKALKELGHVKTLIITGHGQSTGFGQSTDNTGAIIEKHNVWDAFEPYITGEVEKPDKILFLACETAKDRNSIAQHISLLLKDVEIAAPQGKVLSILNITNKSYIIFKNGKIIYQGWL